MKAITILHSILYTNETENMGIAVYDDNDDRDTATFLTEYFGINGMENVKGQFSKGTWLYSYESEKTFSGELVWPDWQQRKERGENLAPDVVITIDNETVIYLYKIDD